MSIYDMLKLKLYTYPLNNVSCQSVYANELIY